METKNMIYIVSEYASQGEIFGELVGGVRLFPPNHLSNPHPSHPQIT